MKTKAPRILKLVEVLEITKLSQASLYRLAKTEPRLAPFKLGEQASAWVAEDVESWLLERIASKISDGIKATSHARATRNQRVKPVTTPKKGTT